MIVLIFSLIFCLITTPVIAQAYRCGIRSEILQLLQMKYGEHRVAVAVDMNQGLLEWFASPEGKWTMIGTRTPNWSCVIASGEGWRIMDDQDGQPMAQYGG